MNHAARVELAQALTQRIRAKYGIDVLGVAVYGSVARSEDSEYSDLEMYRVCCYLALENRVYYITSATIWQQVRKFTTLPQGFG